MGKTSDHAIVFGASLAGLLTARVLAEFYKQVTVVERDALPPPGQQRKGVPHGRHVHGLHPRGREILDELLPDFTAELTAAGPCAVMASATRSGSPPAISSASATPPCPRCSPA